MINFVVFKYAFFNPQGILDMFVLSKAEDQKDLMIHALKNNFEADAYFVKVMGKWQFPSFSVRL